MESQSILSAVGFILFKILVVVSTLVVGAIVFVLIAAPFHILRAVVGILAKSFRQDFIQLTSTRTSVWTGDDFHTSPEMNVTVIVVFKKKLSHASLIEEFKKKVLARYPRLRQHVEFWLGYPFWKWEEGFDINSHLTTHGQSVVGHDELHNLANKVNRKGFPKAWSPWNGVSVEDYKTNIHSEPACAWIFNIHHSISDAFGVQCILLSLVGETDIQIPHNDITVELPFAKMDNTLFKSFNSIYTFATEAVYFKDFNELRQFRSPASRQRDIMYFNSEGTIPFSHVLEIQDHYNVSAAAVMGTISARCIEKVFEQEQLRLPGFVHLMFPSSSPNHSKTTTNHQTLVFCNVPLRSASGVKRLKLVEEDIRRQREARMPKVFEILIPLILGPMPVFLSKLLYKVNLPTAMSFSVTIDKLITFQNTEVAEISFFSGPLPGDQGVYIFFMKYGQNLKMGVALSTTYTGSKTKIADILECMKIEINELRRSS